MESTDYSRDQKLGTELEMIEWTIIMEFKAQHVTTTNHLCFLSE